VSRPNQIKLPLSYNQPHKKAPRCYKTPGDFSFSLKSHQIALVTLPERKQRVQALIRRGEPFTIALTLLTFGFQVLLERLCEWETLIPKAISLLQISHLAMVCTSF
jgi:hypothetical protein